MPDQGASHSRRIFLLLMILVSIIALALIFVLARDGDTPQDSEPIAGAKCPVNFRLPNPPQQTISLPVAIPQSMKGYDVKMQCWQGEWYFTFRIGLNRIKPCEDSSSSSAISEPSYTVKGIDALQAALIHIQSEGPIDTGGQVTWCETGNVSAEPITPDTEMTTSAVTLDESLWYAFDKFDEAGGSAPDSKKQGLFRLKEGEVTVFDIPNTIRILEATPDGALYVGAGCGVLRFRDEEMETLLDLECGRRTSVSKLFPMDIDIADDGLVWVSGVYSLASFDGEDWQEYDIPSVRAVLASDGSLWARGWDGRAGSECCLTHISGGQWMTYTWTADIPAEPHVLSSLFD
jgi:hypothetical protein